jgi:hypothetical protein
VADGTLVKEVERLALASANAQRLITEDGEEHTVSAVKLFPVLPPQLPEPAALVVHTLTGLAEYVRGNIDKLDCSCVLHVVDPMRVDYVGASEGYHRQRFTFAQAEGYVRSNFAFGQFYDLERFNIALQSQFEDYGDRAEVLRIIGNVEDTQVRTQRDDGVGQNVTVKSGIGLEVAAVPNPVSLAPFRTFPEVAQPESRFVLRLRKGANGIEAALFEGDGGAWKVEAIKRVRTWLNGELPGTAIIA